MQDTAQRGACVGVAKLACKVSAASQKVLLHFKFPLVVNIKSGNLNVIGLTSFCRGHMHVLRIFLSLIMVSFLSAPALAQQSIPPETREKSFMAFDNFVEVFGDSVDAVCRKADSIGSAAIYYKLAGYIGYIPSGEGELAVAHCKSGPIQLTPAYHVCITYQLINGIKTFKSYTTRVTECEKPADVCAVTVGNPVDVASLTKVISAEDWKAPSDSRFRIGRNYRSDSVFSARLSGTTDSPHDLFANVWQRSESETLDTAKNPYDPSDTRSWWRYETAAGTAMYFLTTDLNVTLGSAYGYKMSGIPYGEPTYDGNFKITDPQGEIGRAHV